MNQKTRERLLLVCLPGIVTGMIYIWGYGRGAVRRHADATAQSERAAQAMPQMTAVMDASQSAEKMTQQVAAEKARAAGLERELKSLHGRVAQSGQRPRSLSRISKIFDENSIGLAASVRLDASPAPDIELLARKLPVSAPEFWRIEAIGTYTDMVNALQAMRHATEFIVPVSIDMTPAAEEENDNVQQWTLTVWI